MTCALDEASDRAIEAAEKLPRDHPVWLLWRQPAATGGAEKDEKKAAQEKAAREKAAKEKVWAIFQKKCGNPALKPDTEEARLFFYEEFTRMCERFVAGGDAARTEEMHLRELLDEALKSLVVGSKLAVTPNDVQRTPGPSVTELLAQPFDPAYRARRGLGEEGFGG